MIRVMFDTDIFDAFVADPKGKSLFDAAAKAKKICVVSTHIQRDQQEPISEPKRSMVRSIPTTSVPTTGAVWDISKHDEATWPTPADAVTIKTLGRGKIKDTKDALIALTAARQVGILVTKDKRLINRIRRDTLAVRVLNYEEFLGFLEGL